MTTTANTISAKGLVKRFGSVTALQGLDLEVPQGTVLGLLGPNGAGKTTAVSILTTLLEPDEGQATIAGIDLRKDPNGVRRSIGLSGQYAAVDEVLTGFENLDMIGRLYRLGRKQSKERARELLRQFDLVEAGDRPAKTYSGGMRRRLDLAGALVASPPVIFLDEPTTGLDPRSRLDLWQVIRDLVTDGATVLLTTQYLEEADQLADNIMVIDSGEAIAEGTADQLKAQVGGERIEVVVADSARLEETVGVLAAVGMGEVDVDRATRRLLVPVDDGVGKLALVLAELQAGSIAVNDIGLRRPTLDDVFLSLTGHGTSEDAPGGIGMIESIRHMLADTMVIAKRNAIKIHRVPEVLVFVLISPIMFILLFAYVFGGSIAVPGSNYREFLVPGIFAQTVVFGSTFTGAGIAEDMQKGIINRFRSLPMSRVAVLAGRTASDVIYNAASLFIMVLTGLLVGWRIRNGIVDAMVGFVLLLAFAYAVSWIMALVALHVPSPEVVNNASFMVIFPLTFIANTFVPSDNLPGPLKTFAEWNPVSTITQAARERFGNIPEGTPDPSGWALQNATLYTLLWSVAIVAIFAPLATAKYRKAVKN